MYLDLRHCRIREDVYRFTTLENKGECISIYDIAEEGRMYIDLRHCRIRENVYRFTTLPNKGECISIYDIA